YGQIADRVKFAVAAGVLRPGDMVPSVRELSKQLVVNPNTVARAYRDLQAEGLLDTVRGTGLQGTEGATERCRGARREHGRGRRRGGAGGRPWKRPAAARWTRARSRRSSARSGTGPTGPIGDRRRRGASHDPGAARDPHRPLDQALRPAGRPRRPLARRPRG